MVLYTSHDAHKQLRLVVFVFQMIDRICVKVQDHLNSLRNSETDVILEDVRSAESLIKDARNSKTVRTEASSRKEILFYTLMDLSVMDNFIIPRGKWVAQSAKTHNHEAKSSK